jgi:hypothetical protein
MREIRPSGSVRGVRSNPYPYRDTPPPDAAGSALLIFTVSSTLIPGQNTPPSPLDAPSNVHIATLLDRESTAQSPTPSAANPPSFAEIILKCSSGYHSRDSWEKC